MGRENFAVSEEVSKTFAELAAARKMNKTELFAALVLEEAERRAELLEVHRQQQEMMEAHRQEEELLEQKAEALRK